jgi:hypothetical protein
MINVTKRHIAELIKQYCKDYEIKNGKYCSYKEISEALKIKISDLDNIVDRSKHLDTIVDYAIENGSLKSELKIKRI